MATSKKATTKALPANTVNASSIEITRVVDKRFTEEFEVVFYNADGEYYDSLSEGTLDEAKERAAKDMRENHCSSDIPKAVIYQKTPLLTIINDV